MTTLLDVERIKLVTTRSPWWCMAIAVVLTVGFAALIAATVPSGFPTGVLPSQLGYQFGLVVMMVMAALAVTTEYRTGTIRATFLAAPRRAVTLASKTVVVALAAGVVGEVTAWVSWGVSRAIRPEVITAVTTGQQLRAVAGVGLIYLIGAVIALAVGMLLRHTAGAIAVLLIWVLLVESLVQIIPKVGSDIHHWMPFTVAGHFLFGGSPAGASLAGASGGGGFGSGVSLSPGLSLAYFAAVGAILLAAALITAEKRDA
jgi:ABC-2 type transport system permease protein